MSFFESPSHFAPEVGGLEAIKCYDLHEKRKLSEHLKIGDKVYVSVHEGFSLKQYINVRQFICKHGHSLA